MTRWVAGHGPDAVSLVLVGDELLVGDVVDTNAAWLGRRLTEAGLRVVSATHVADDVDAQVVMLRRALADAPSVVVTGGLGPTSDDVCRAALARLAGVPLRRDPAVVAALEEWFARYDAVFPPGALQMADIPEGAASLGNLQGSAPGIRLAMGDGVVYAVPGVPHEMRAMIEEYVLSDLLARAGTLPVRRSATWRIVGLRESVVAARLAPLEADLANLGAAAAVENSQSEAGAAPRGWPQRGADLAYVASPGQVLVRITIVQPPGSDPGEVDTTITAYAARAADLLGDAVAGPGEQALDEVVHRLLAQQQATVATAESFTGGLLGASLTDMPGSSTTFRGGVVAYATELKHDLLGVSRSDLTNRGAVDPQTAIAMAKGVRRRLAADFGVATTGVAGPSRQEDHPPGTAHIAVAGPDGLALRTLRLPGDRASVREAGVVHALDLLRRMVSGLPAEPSQGIS